MSILVLNPNSSESVTEGLRDALTSPSSSASSFSVPPGVKLHFRTGPASAPPSINDAPTSIQSAWANFAELGGGDVLAPYDAVLVCCFSDHPLVGMLRHELAAVQHRRLPVMHILESSVVAALAAAQGRPFGILTTGADMVRDIDAGVRVAVGASASTRYVGCAATGLGVVEMRTTDAEQRDRVRQTIRQKTAALAQRDPAIGAIIVGCAGMVGFEQDIRAGIVEALGQDAGRAVAIIDGVKAGVQLMAAQLRAGFYEF